MKTSGTVYSAISNFHLPQNFMFGYEFLKTRLISLYQNVRTPYILTLY